MNIVNKITQIKNTSGKIEKNDLLSSFCNTSDKYNSLMRFILDDRITTGLNLKKIRNTSVKACNEVMDTSTIIDYLTKNNTGTYKDISVAKGFLSTLPKDAISIYEQILTRTLNLGIGVKSYNEVFPDNKITLFEPMKGNIYDSEQFNKIRKKYGQRFALTLKLDGNRSTYTKDDITGKFQFISPNGRLHKGYNHIISEIKDIFNDKYFIDGEFEFYDEKGTMTNDEIRQKTSSICSSNTKEKIEIRYKIFHILPIDEWESGNLTTKYFNMRETFMTNFDKCIKEKNCKYISILPLLYNGTDEDMIMNIFKKQRENHKEGVIINFDCPYVVGKKDGIMKVKDVLTLDLKITGWKYGKENTRLSSCLGALEVELNVDGANYTVDVGGGFSDSFRKEFVLSPDDYIGKIAEILATEVSKNKEGGVSLSYPRFVEIRADKTIPDKIVSDGKKFKII